jgi:uncharacterized protein
MDDERENLTWQAFGEASRELAKAIAADGFEPDLILSIARGGLFRQAPSVMRSRSRTCT